MKNIMPFDELNTDKFLKFGEYYGMVIEVKPISFKTSFIKNTSV